MKSFLKSEIGLAIGILIFTVLVDQLLKGFAIQYQWQELAFNPGIIQGLFSDVPPLLRVVVVVSLSGILLFVFGLIMFLLPSHTLKLRLGIGVYVGAILSNSLDRLMHGAVVDWVRFRFGGWQTSLLNFADLVQWPAIGLILYSLYQNSERLWPENNLRKFKTIHPHFQGRIRRLILFSVLANAILSWIFAFTFLKVTLAHSVAHSFIGTKTLWMFTGLFFLIQTCYLLLVYLLAQIISQRMAGPLFAFERYVRRTLQGKSQDEEFRLRANDEFQELETLAQKIKDYVVKHP